MGRRGPPPKPVALRLIEGNRSKRAIPPDMPKPRASLPSCPGHLDKEAKKEWRRIGRELDKLHLVTQIDRSALAAYCQCYSRWVKAEGNIQRFGEVVKGTKGNLVKNPYIRIAHESLLLLKSFCQEFGLTPSSRSRIQLKPPGREKDLDELLA